MFKNRFYILLYLLLFLNSHSVCQNDTLNKPIKNSFLFFGNVGYPIISRFNLKQYSYGKETSYWVNSKFKSIYVFGFEYSRKKFNIGLSGSYIQNEFIGKDFEYNVMAQIGGSRSLPTSIAKYNLYQKFYNNVFQVSLISGFKFKIAEKHILSINISISSNLINDHRISNYYSSNQLGYDTTKYTLIKNGYSYENTSKFPSFGFIIIYNYKLTKYFFIDCKLTSQFFYAYYKNNSDDIKENAIMIGQSNSRDVYTINKNIFIAPTIGIKYKIK